MKIKCIILACIIGLIICPNQLFSQSVQVMGATSQGWAGGACCQTGIDYRIRIKISDMHKKIKLDSLYMNGCSVDISKYYDAKTNNTDSFFVVIREGVTWDDAMPMYNWCFELGKKGILMTYYMKGRKKRLEITPYIKELEFIEYP